MNLNTGDVRRISSDLRANSPRISGQRVVWRSGDVNFGTREDIFLYDIATGQTQQLTFQPDNQTTPDIDGNRVVFMDGRLGGPDWDIFMLELPPPSAAIQGLEADVAPRDQNGNGILSVSDWVQVGRYVAALDPVPTGPGSAFQKADCAPRQTGGDGRLTVSDWVQAGRYVAGLDPPQSAAGPTQPQQ